MKFTIKACKRLKAELDVDLENIGDALQDPEKAQAIAVVGLETAGKEVEGAEDLTVSDILDALTRDMGGATAKKLQAETPS